MYGTIPASLSRL
jgi:kinase